MRHQTQLSNILAVNFKTDIMFRFRYLLFGISLSYFIKENVLVIPWPFSPKQSLFFTMIQVFNILLVWAGTFSFKMIFYFFIHDRSNRLTSLPMRKLLIFQRLQWKGILEHTSFWKIYEISRETILKYNIQLFARLYFIFTILNY